MTKITKIEGIGGTYEASLAEAGVTTVEGLLAAGGSKKGRQELSDKVGVSTKVILNWVNRADLFRVKGLGTQYTDLLEAAGVDTVPELAQRNAANLHAKMAEVNAEKKKVRQLPSAKQVADWVAFAKTLERAVNY